MKPIFFCYKLLVKVVSVDASINNIGWALWAVSDTGEYGYVRSGFFKTEGADELARCQFINRELHKKIFSQLNGYPDVSATIVERVFSLKGSRVNHDSMKKLAMAIGALSTCFPHSKMHYVGGHKTKYGAAWLVDHYKIKKRLTEHELDAISIGHYWLEENSLSI